LHLTQGLPYPPRGEQRGVFDTLLAAATVMRFAPQP